MGKAIPNTYRPAPKVNPPGSYDTVVSSPTVHLGTAVQQVRELALYCNDTVRQIHCRLIGDPSVAPRLQTAEKNAPPCIGEELMEIQQTLSDVKEILEHIQKGVSNG